MRSLILLAVLIVYSFRGLSQDDRMDSISNAIITAESDSSRADIFAGEFFVTIYSNPDRAIAFTQRVLLTLKEHKLSKQFEAEVLNNYGYALGITGNYPMAIKYLLQSLEIINENKPTFPSAVYNDIVDGFYGNIIETYRDDGDYANASIYLNKSWEYMSAKARSNNNKEVNNHLIGSLYAYYIHKATVEEKSNNLDSALQSINVAIGLEKKHKLDPWAYIQLILGDIYRKKNDFSSAIKYYKNAESLDIKYSITKDQMDVYNGLAKIFMKLGIQDSCIQYATETINLGKSYSYPLAELEAFSILSEEYKSQNKLDSTVKYLQLTSDTKDSLFNQAKERQVQNISFETKMQLEEQQQASRETQRKYRIRLFSYILIGCLLISFIVGMGLWRNRQKQMADLRHKTIEMEMQALRAQMNPHFLFNTLNNLYSLVYEKSDKAPGMLMRLSGLLSHVLYECKADAVPLSKEVKVIHDYVELERERYGDRLELSFLCSGELENKMIAPMIFQPFIENAFKHGSSEQLGKVWMSIDLSVIHNQLEFKLVNSYDGTKPLNVGEGIGIRNVQKRLELLYPGKYGLQFGAEEDVYVVSLSLELIH